MKNKKNNNSISLKKILIVFLMTIASGIVFILKYPPVSGLYFQSSNKFIVGVDSNVSFKFIM